MAAENEPDEGTVRDVFIAQVLGERAEELEFIGFKRVWVVVRFVFMVLLAVIEFFVAFSFGFVACLLRCLFDFGG